MSDQLPLTSRAMSSRKVRQEFRAGIRDGIIPELEDSGIDSRWLQEQLGVPVVNVFNSITAESIKRLKISE